MRPFLLLLVEVVLFMEGPLVRAALMPVKPQRAEAHMPLHAPTPR